MVDAVNTPSPVINVPAQAEPKAANQSALATASAGGGGAVQTPTPGAVAAVAPGVGPTTVSPTRPAVTPGVVARVASSTVSPAGSGALDAGAVSPGAADPMGVVQARSPVDANQTASDGKPDSKAGRKAGAGVNGATSGQSPPVNTAATSAASTASADGINGSFALASVARFMPSGKYSDPEVTCTLALEGTNAVRNQNCRAQIERLNRERETQADAQEANAKRAQDEEAQSHDDGWGTFFKDLALVAACVAAVFTGGTTAVAVIAVLEVANEVAEKETGHGLAGSAFRAVGAGNYADKADLVFACALAVATIVVGGGGDTGAVAKLASAVEAGGHAGSAVEDRVAAGHAANAQQASADAKVAEARVEGIDERFKKVVDLMKKTSNAQAQMLADAQELQRFKGHTARNVA